MNMNIFEKLRFNKNTQEEPKAQKDVQQEVWTSLLLR